VVVQYLVQIMTFSQALTRTWPLPFSWRSPGWPSPAAL
jgi:hypothetical protein